MKPQVFFILLIVNFVYVLTSSATETTAAIDLTRATVVVRGNAAPLVERTAATVLVEEVEKRTGIKWPIATKWPKAGPAVAIVSGKNPTLDGRAAPKNDLPDKPEGYTVKTIADDRGHPTVWIVGTDPNGAFYGVGKLLRTLNWSRGSINLDRPLNAAAAPQHTIRGHQLGYRNKSNSYDAWDPARYDQYIRELALFGANAVENIPWQDDDGPLMPVSRREMNLRLSEICKKYGVAYWVWTPATIDLSNAKKRAELLADHAELYRECAQIDSIFFPGGDPGNNPPQLVMPFLEEVAKLLQKHHPQAQVWLSMQKFEQDEVDFVFEWLNEHNPQWFGGLVGGPSSQPLPVLRARLPKKYRLRDYPDITHTVRSQYQSVWLDPAFAYTSGREGTNPEPVYYSTIFRAYDQYTDGFISYSDGMHDDVNKTVWSTLGWNPDTDVRQTLLEYCRFFFGPELAERATDGIYALEKNWSGSLRDNGGVEATLALWTALEEQAPQLKDNWRWQLCLLKANYDAYIRARLIHESDLEEQANRALAEAKQIGADAAMDRALKILAKADTDKPRHELRAKILDLCDRLFHSIGYQSSVPKYQANNTQRSAVLDFVDHPLNNRWWYEDQIAEIRRLKSKPEKLARLETIRTWESPGNGSFYDDIGNVAKSPHVIRGEVLTTDPRMRRNPNPGFMWWDGGMTRVRQSWISYIDWPLGLRYEGLDPTAQYTVRTTGYGQCLLRVNGRRVKPTLDGKGIGEIKEFPLDPKLYADGKIILTFDVPHEPGVNWRRTSRLTEVWLLKDHSK